MFKTKIIIALLVSGISCSASAADVGVGGLPLGGLPKGEEPKTTDVDGVPLIEESTKPKLKSVKDLFKSSKDSTPKVPDIISNKPEIVEIDKPEPIPVTIPEPIPEPVAPPSPAPAPVAAPKDNIQNEEIPSIGGDDENIDITAEGTSIMFDQTNIYRVMRVLSAYIESQSNKVDAATQEQSKKSLAELQEELLAKLANKAAAKDGESTKTEIITVRLPAYVRLDSLIFRTPTNKKVWVNSRKFSENEGNGEILVKAIQPEWAYIELSAKDTNTNFKRLAQNLKKTSSSANIKIDAKNQTISFRLSVNQYIDIALLEIKEGDFTGGFGKKYYDPTKPEDRFVPIEEAEEALEAESLQEAAEQAAEELKLEEIKPVDEIDAGEAIDSKGSPAAEEIKPVEEKEAEVEKEAEKTIIETSPEKK